MEINVQFVKMATSDHLEVFAIKKLEKLAKKFDWIIKADVFFKIKKDPKGKGKICDIQLSMPGPRIFATSDDQSFEPAPPHRWSNPPRSIQVTPSPPSTC